MPRVLVEAVVRRRSDPAGDDAHLEYYSALQRAAQVEGLRTRHEEACAHALANEPGDASEGPFERQPQTVRRSSPATSTCVPTIHCTAVIGQGLRRRARACPRRRLAATPSGTPQPPTLGVHDCHQWPDPFACDFIFASSDLRPRLRAVAVDARSAASDHQPMMVELA